MELLKLSKRIRFFRRAVFELFLAAGDLNDHVTPGPHIRDAMLKLYVIVMELSARYPGAELGTEDEVDDWEPGDWLETPRGPDGVAIAPALYSDRIKDYARRAVLEPGSLSKEEVFDLGAAVLSHLASEGL